MRKPKVQWVLEQAERMLVKHGWVKGTSRDAKGSMCIAGAIVEASAQAGIAQEQAFAQCRQVMIEDGISGLIPITVFNDAPSTTFPQIQSLLWRAAQKAREQGV